jgi:hypothetical protein
MILRYILMLHLNSKKRLYVAHLKKIKSSEVSVGSTNVRNTRFERIISILSSHWIFLILPVLWGFFFSCILFFEFSITGFSCKDYTTQIFRYTHVVFILIWASLIFLLLMFDLIMNIKDIVFCKCKKYFFINDPFHYRLEMILIVIGWPLPVIWALAPFPMILRSILADFQIFIVFCISGLIALTITIYKNIIFYLSKKKLESKSNFIQQILLDENLLEIFQKFCEGEWSTENILLKVGIHEYNQKGPKEREMLANEMKENFLIVDLSPLEVNAPSRVLKRLVENIEKPGAEFPDDLFNEVEKYIDENLSDTIGRFNISAEYTSYNKAKDTYEKSLGL